MYTRWVFLLLIHAAATALLTGCASSGVANYSAMTPAELAAEVAINRDTETVVYSAPRINSRASFGQFSKGMLGGGSTFSSAITLRGERTADKVTSNWLIAEVVYTNLGGFYRHYDRAGIEGIPTLAVIPVSTDRHFNINSANMTEIVKIEVADADLRSRQSSGFVLRLLDDSDNLIEYNVPANYIGGYLLALDNDNTR